jgi:archaeosortase A (PGF-CTERM-specific)
MEEYNYSEGAIASIFIFIPTAFIIMGLSFFTFPINEEMKALLPIPLFAGLILLGLGSFLKKEGITNKLKIAGWGIFAFYWSTQPNTLYFGEGEDFVNAFLCIVGVYVLFYLAYHEWLSMKRKEIIGCLNWIAGASAIAGFIYFVIELTPLASLLIETVAIQSGLLLDIFIGNVSVERVNIFYEGSYVVSIIFACTAVQSMVIFVGMILPLAKVILKRKIYGLLITVVPIYFLNLIRNALIVYLVKDDPSFFFMAHNVIGKGGSLLALVILLFIVIKIVPEIFDNIIDLTDLPKRNGPLENFIKKTVWRKK